MREAIKLSPNVYWVGAHDFDLRHFHGSMFPIDEGTSYNAYLIVDEQITLIDTVEADFIDVMLERITSVIKDRNIDHIIVQHAEPDHSSGFIKFMEKYPNAKPHASISGIRLMMKQYFKDYSFHQIKTGELLCTGHYHFTFLEMPLIHWPDNILTYLEEEKIVFSSDAFGQHIASYDMFDDAHPLNKCIDKAKDYYANIVMPYGDRVLMKLKEIENMKITIDMIAPAHGIIWHSHVAEILDAYHDFASFKADNKAIILYESVWNNTKHMAEALSEGLGKNGICVKLFKISETSSALIMKELLDSKAIFIGSGCYNNAIAIEVIAFLEKLSINKPKHKLGLGFGSYGWFKNVPNEINQRIEKAGITLLDEGIAQCCTPTSEDFEHIIALGEKYADQIKNSDI
ncbi:MAG: flavodoxin domain-containing protein [Erysipelotrichaceae bacterium]